LTQKEVIGIPIYRISDETFEHLHPCEMMQCEAPLEKGQHGKCLGTAGDYVLVMSATGETVRESSKMVYRRLAELIVPNSPMWRTDIGDRLRKELPLLQQHKYAKAMLYQPASSTPSQTERSMSSKNVSMRVGNLEIIYV
jgi:hypothetical protein